MRYAIAGLSMLLGSLSLATPAMAQVSVSVSIPGVSIGIHQPVYPDLVLVPGSPVYYAPQAQANYFFYDGLYWVYQDDRWYASSWYNGPWDLVEPDDVPLFVLRVPVRYYVHPPVYFSGWLVTAPPRWELYWGPRWTRHYHGWDHWDRRLVYAPAPLPAYQRHYAGDRYPRREYQHVIRNEHYRYQPRDAVVRRHEQQHAAPRPQVHAQPHNRPAQHGPDIQREQRSQRDREKAQRPQRDRGDARQAESQQVLPQQRAQEQRPSPRQEPERRSQAPAQPVAQARPETPRPQPAQRAAVSQERQQQPQSRHEQAPRAQQAPRPQQAQGPQGRGDAPQPRAGAEQRQGPRPDRGQERGQDRGRDRGQGRG